MILFGICLSFLFTISLTPLINKFGLRHNFIDRKDFRKKKSNLIVRIGGLGIFSSILISFSITLLFFYNNIDFFQLNILKLLFFGSTIFFLIGLIDDKVNISPFLRLILQAIIVCSIWSFGFGVESFTLFDKSYVIKLPQFLSLLITFLWLAGVANAINWTDGIDGLATSLAGSSAIFISLISFHNNQITLVVLSSILASSCFGFLIFNRNPASIMMGDCGSNFLGFLLGGLCLMASQTNYTVKNNLEIDFVLPFLILIIPIFDMIRVICIRLMKKRMPFFPDRNHLHYLLLDNGLSNKKTVTILVMLNIIFGIISLCYVGLEINLVLTGLILSLILFCIPLKILNKSTKS
ncbi:undecaprenyl/decaprenyl-phosphate alpha-N-acetylglucosaminyl 1-phosphate transferase [Prochlorococcus sp. AH-716-M06]|nr:undecaprenyl/decaprenyl-phosphate alpha-N-acetylglucosaminyl 1-phosphate transferase [Prochlorococcus sp. AH-716-M06]